MKQFKFIYITILSFFIIPYCNAQTLGDIVRDTITGNITERDPWAVVADEQSYTSGIGGIVFTYPITFTNPPYVQLSIIQNVSHPNTQTYVAEISANSTTSTTVMVYLVSSGTVSEAPTGDVTVSILALDNPV